MMKKILTVFLIGMSLCSYNAKAQDDTYVATPVTVSKEKTKNAAGEVFYSHVVLERQTLYSISKAYGVSVEDICSANKALNLDTEGLKKNQIILIPTSSDSSASHVETSSPSSQSETEYIVHTVKWFEDMATISAKYGVPADVIMEFNGMTSQSVSRRQQIRIPRNYKPSASQPATASGTGVPYIEETAVAESNTQNDNGSVWDDLFSFGKKDIVNMSLILPLDSKGQPAENPYDFYCGALVALRDLEAEGIKVRMDVFDCAHGAMPAETADFNRSDLVIGPITSADVAKALEKCQDNSVIVSPLEQKVASLAATNSNMVQLPCSAEMQARELVSWLREEIAPSDKVILVTEKSKALTGNAAMLKARMDSSHVNYTLLSYGILEGRDIINRMENLSSKDGVTRVVIASESEAFVNDAIRNVSLLNVRKHDAVSYCLAKVRNFDTIDVEQFHTTRMHICTQYFVDYSEPKVMDFLMTYRALYNAEPGPFAFQGYDSTYQMVKACAENGRNWAKRLAGTRAHGLQTDLQFVNSASGSAVNTAVRRILFDRGYDIRLVSVR